jgi:hypothetical protein
MCSVFLTLLGGDVNESVRIALLTLILPFILINITGCGDGGGEVDGDGNEVVKTGYFIGVPVEGLVYNTATQSGITGADGSFLYQEREDFADYFSFRTLIAEGLDAGLWGDC